MEPRGADNSGFQVFSLSAQSNNPRTKGALKRLRQSEERYLRTLNDILEGCQIIDYHWRYLYVNDAAARQGRKAKGELIHHTMMEVYPGIENTAMYANLRDCMENRVAVQMESEFSYPDGSSGWFELNIQPAPEGIFILSVDITERKQAEMRAQQSSQELIMAYDATITGWSYAMDLRDRETKGHTQRVTELTLQLAELLGVRSDEMVHIRRGALLHDIGKLGVPDQILLKPGQLTEDEWIVMRQHPSYAYDMLMPIAYLRKAVDIPHYHHEKWDGSGYPHGLKGEQIPLSARLFAVVDVWDALRSDRPYRAKWSADQARKYIIEQSGIHFDPQVVDIFLELVQDGS